MQYSDDFGTNVYLELIHGSGIAAVQFAFEITLKNYELHNREIVSLWYVVCEIKPQYQQCLQLCKQSDCISARRKNSLIKFAHLFGDFEIYGTTDFFANNKRLPRMEEEEALLGR